MAASNDPSMRWVKYTGTCVNIDNRIAAAGHPSVPAYAYLPSFEAKLMVEDGRAVYETPTTDLGSSLSGGVIY